jgi:outer membrane receptor protein involved in Fe transport
LFDEAAGNPALAPELSNNYEIGAERRLPRGSAVSLTLFRADVRDYIERPGQDELFSNYEAYRFHGLEATAETRALPRLLLRAGYSLLATDDRSPDSPRDELQYRPRHQATLEARYAVGAGLTTGVAVRHVAGQVYYSRQEPIVQADLPDYTLLGLRLGYLLPGYRAQAYLGADNLFNVAFEEEYGAPQATRIVYGGVAIRW